MRNSSDKFLVHFNVILKRKYNKIFIKIRFVYRFIEFDLLKLDHWPKQVVEAREIILPLPGREFFSATLMKLYTTWTIPSPKNRTYYTYIIIYYLITVRSDGAKISPICSWRVSKGGRWSGSEFQHLSIIVWLN